MCFLTAPLLVLYLFYVRCERNAIRLKNDERNENHSSMTSIEEYLKNPDDVTLARHLAHTLSDRSSIAYYLTLSRSYSHELLLEILESVMKIPDEKITTRRAAIFVANIKRYVPGQ